jgi:hypothetical protein
MHAQASSGTSSRRSRSGGAAANGMLYNEGGRFFGYGLYLLKGKPVFTYNNQGIKRTK